MIDLGTVHDCLKDKAAKPINIDDPLHAKTKLLSSTRIYETNQG
jgi:hypothetical protein